MGLSTCQDGSILLLHMPEVYVRQWCYTALEQLLKGLYNNNNNEENNNNDHRNLQVVPLGEMARLHQFQPELGVSSLFHPNNNNTNGGGGSGAAPAQACLPNMTRGG